MSLRRSLLAAALALAACTDAGPAIRSGALTAMLESPHGEEGAAILLLIGEGVVDVRAAGDAEVHAYTAGQSTNVVLIHPTGGTLSFEVDLTDWRRRPVVEVREVAGPYDDLRADLSGYRVTFSR